MTNSSNTKSESPPKMAYDSSDNGQAGVAVVEVVIDAVDDVEDFGR